MQLKKRKDKESKVLEKINTVELEEENDTKRVSLLIQKKLKENIQLVSSDEQRA